MLTSSIVVTGASPIVEKLTPTTKQVSAEDQLKIQQGNDAQLKTLKMKIEERVEGLIVEPSFDKTLPSNFSFEYMSAFETEMFHLVNEYRIENGLTALKLRSDLNETARYKSNSLLQLNYFGHENPNFGGGRISALFWDVFNLKHYRSIGENLVVIYDENKELNTAQACFECLKKSPEHNANMLTPEWKYAGYGILSSESSGSKLEGRPALICTQHFAKN